jgi:phosphate/sulfate permease
VLVFGLATYGYNIMAVLGNRLTLMSPSRGYSMELGASITVILASQFAIPVSTTMWCALSLLLPMIVQRASPALLVRLWVLRSATATSALSTGADWHGELSPPGRGLR